MDLARNESANQSTNQMVTALNPLIHTLILLYTTDVTNIYSIWALDGAHARFTEQVRSLISAIDTWTVDMFGRSGPVLILGVNFKAKLTLIIRFNKTLGWMAKF